jgi:predicted pyridoxine 5'-phosphate oxidase superfamily flavin-nucleotide-binding protein
MADFYGDESRKLQERFGARRLADSVQRLVHDALTPADAAVVEAADMFFLATVDAQGRPSCSYKGGDPGFVRVLDPRQLAFPSYDGNGMFLSMGNALATGQVGLLFIDFEQQTRMRLNGTATLSDDPADPLLAAWPEAQLVVRVAIREVFPNCPRYVHRYQRAERSAFVPRAGCTTPVPAWKRADWAKDSLPEGDPAHDPDRELRRK